MIPPKVGPAYIPVDPNSIDLDEVMRRHKDIPTLMQELQGGAKDTNPKYAAGMKKIPLANVPPILTAYAAIAFHEGLLKYGAWNWRAKGASAKTYIAAAKRHLDLWLEGEECDEKTGSPHLGNALACIGIILDARSCGVLEDDRPPASGYSKELEKLNAQVENLNKIFGKMNPVHYTINWKNDSWTLPEGTQSGQDNSNPSKPLDV